MEFKLTYYQKQLLNIGKTLRLTSSTEELVIILQEMEKLLLRSTALLHNLNVSSSRSLIYAMNPMIKVLIAKKLLRHPDMDVNISVACCICAVFRPLDFFELVVIAFEKLSSASGGCFSKMTRVLQRLSCGNFSVWMRDLQLDGLIHRLFKQFLTFADSNSAAVVNMMRYIMTMITRESKPLDLRLVELIVACVRKENQIRQEIFIDIRGYFKFGCNDVMMFVNCRSVALAPANIYPLGDSSHI
ncbi:phospholipase-like protein [Tanacetum coccineum]